MKINENIPAWLVDLVHNMNNSQIHQALVYEKRLQDVLTYARESLRLFHEKRKLKIKE